MNKYYLGVITTVLTFTSCFTANAASVINKVQLNTNIQKGLQFEARRLQEKNPDSVAFEVKIIPKTVELPKYTNTSLSLVEITKNSSTIRGVRKLSCSNVDKTLLCRFNVPFDLLKNPKLSFVYTIHITSVINGRVVRRPSNNYLYFNLKDVSGI